MAIPSGDVMRTLWYRGFTKLPGDRFRVQWSLSPTAPGKLFVDQTCHDVPPRRPAGRGRRPGRDGGRSLFDEATIALPVPAQATPQTRWVRLTRLGPGDAPAACPTPWIAFDLFAGARPRGDLLSDGSPVAPWGCGPAPARGPRDGLRGGRSGLRAAADRAGSRTST
ncbi:MAG: hypothetical protein R3F43_28695 [bacterium]